jgi:two-component system sensor histidine kinase ChvG
MTARRERLGAGPRSLRFKLIALGVVLALLPLLMLAISWTYEQALVAEEVHRLGAVARQAAAMEPASLRDFAGRSHVEIVRFDAAGAITARSDTMALALGRSAVGQLGEKLVGADAPESLERADHEFSPWPERDEVKSALGGRAASATRLSRSAETVVITLAQPLPAGGALYVLTGSHRGVRRLIVVRRELVQLALYEVVLALPLLLLYGFRVVRPIARLADAARRYPAVPLADDGLMARGDEIATLARTLSAMAADIESRRRQAVDLGSDIAHEFKNPLASITASAELLSSTKTLTPERVALVTSTIGQSVERLRRSIDDLLALLRLEAAVPGEPREPSAYGALLQELRAEYQRDPRYADWQFTLDATDAPDDLPLNRRRWAELLRNLIDNALVQPAARKEIVVTVRRTAEGLVTAVRDHGPGISAENKKLIFRRFFSDRPPGAPPGSGLGLSVAETIAQAHGGRIELHSEPGQGAEFRVILPV